MGQPSENLGCLTAILRLFGLAGEIEEPKEKLPYRTRDDFLSAPEVSFYHVLAKAVGDAAIVCPKVRISDVLFVMNRRQNMKYVNKIDRKHVDFLLCEPGTVRPLVAVELDDSSHFRRHRQDRDEFVDQAFGTAGLPITHFPQRESHAVQDVAQQVQQYLSPDAATSEITVPPGETTVGTDSDPPLCPKCGVSMVVRKANKGQHQGKRFYACPNYPQCRALVPIDS